MDLERTSSIEKFAERRQAKVFIFINNHHYQECDQEGMCLIVCMRRCWVLLYVIVTMCCAGIQYVTFLIAVCFTATALTRSVSQETSLI